MIVKNKKKRSMYHNLYVCVCVCVCVSLCVCARAVKVLL